MLATFYVFKTTHNNPFDLVSTYVNVASVFVHNEQYLVYIIYIYICWRCTSNRGETLPQDALEFCGCMTDPRITVYHITICTIKQLGWQL